MEDLGTELRNIDWKEVAQRLEDYYETGEKRLKTAHKTSKDRLKEWRKTGDQSWQELEHRWSELQARTEAGFWDLRAMVQRVNEGLQPYLNRDLETSASQYFLQKGSDGRWALVLDGANAPTMVFENKGEGIKAARRYVRGRAPSLLTVRRADGTFQHVYKYSE